MKKKNCTFVFNLTQFTKNQINFELFLIDTYYYTKLSLKKNHQLAQSWPSDNIAGYIRDTYLWCLRSLSWWSWRPSGNSIPPSDSVRAVACAGRGDSGGWYGEGLLAGDGGRPEPGCGDTVPGWIPSMQYGSLNPVDATRTEKQRNNY